MKRALVVDDNAVNRKLAVALLQRRGWDTTEAENGAECLELLTAQPFDAVVLDIHMPVLNGEETCRRIRANPDWAGLRVVAYTAHAQESERDRILGIGFDDLIIKPAFAKDFMRALPD